MNVTGKSVLVTGGAGFIGSHLVDELIARGASKVVAVDNLFLGRRENLSAAEGAGEGFSFVELDASDFDGMSAVIAEHGVEAVFDLAVIPLPTSLERPKWSVDVNVLITTTLCELAKAGAFETLIHFSSSEALGTAQQVPMSEDHPLAPTTPYAASKAAGDHIVLSYVRTFGIDASILRPFNNYGPRQNDQAYAGIIPIVIRRIQANQAIEIFGDGFQTRDFLYATDTAAAAVSLYECPASRGLITNVAAGRETSVNDLVAALKRVMGAEDHPVVHGPERPGDVRRHVADVGRARELFGFRPRVDPDEGLRQTVEWYVSGGGS